MDRVRHLTASPPRRPLAALLLVLAGCLASGGRERQLVTGGSRVRELPGTERLELPSGASVLVLGSRSRRVPDAWRQPAFVARLEAFVRDGGGLLLLGGAAGVAAELGLAPAPDVEARVLGRDGAARATAFGLRLGGAAPASLGPGADRWLWEGTHGRVLSACMPEPGDGRVWAWSLERRGARSEVGAPILVAWGLGEGRVVALGSSAWTGDPALVEALLVELDGGRRGGLCSLPVVAADPEVDGWREDGAVATPPFGASLVGPRVVHQGRSADEEALVAPDDAGVQAALAAGADLFVARGRAERDAAADRALRLRARALHDRGALLALDLGSAPTPPPEALAGVLAAPGADEDPVDGLGRPERQLDWLVGLRSLQPGAFAFGAAPAPSASATGIVRPEAGRVGDLPVRGLVAPELDRCHPPGLFDLCELEADAALGARPDWLAAQVLAFVRSRDRAAVVVHGAERATAPDFVADLVERPLASAMSFRLEATGRGGLRESLARSRDDAPPFLRALGRAPADRMVAQNRFLRVEGSEGGLLYDAGGSGDFEGGHVLAARFSSVRLHGLRPVPSSLPLPPLELELRDERADVATIAVPEDEDWLPRQVRQPLEKRVALAQGTWVLELEGRAEAGGAVCAVRVDGVLYGCLAAAGGVVDRRELRLGLASSRVVTLSFEPVTGDGFDLSRTAFVRIDDAGLEADGGASAGPRALLVERVGSSYCSEVRRTVLLGDLPAVVHDVRYQRVLPGVGVERRLGFAGYEVVAERRLEGFGRVALRLACPDGGRPDLWVVMAGLGRHDRLRHDPGDGLVLDSHPRGHAGLVVGVLLAGAVGAGADPEALLVACEECLRTQRLVPDAGVVPLRRRYGFPWRRLVVVPDDRAGLRRLAGGLEVAVRPRPSGEGLRGVLLADGDGLHVAALSLPAPGPGARRLLALAPSTAAAGVALVARSPLLPTPTLRVGRRAVRSTGTPGPRATVTSCCCPRRGPRSSSQRPSGSSACPGSRRRPRASPAAPGTRTGACSGSGSTRRSARARRARGRSGSACSGSDRARSRAPCCCPPTRPVASASSRRPGSRCRSTARRPCARSLSG
ncbi:MAG: hypothetical protein R3F30_04315 [Planctomycetota bacterium]